VLNFPKLKIPIQKITIYDKEIFIKREDLIHPDISGNKYWKLFYNVNNFLKNNTHPPLIISFGGAFSNHIVALAAFGNIFKIPTMGIIRGEELKDNFSKNPTLNTATNNGMIFRFVSRTLYRDKDRIVHDLRKEFPEALIVPEGGSNLLATQGVKFMLSEQTKDFDYLCTAVGTGGTIAGISKFVEDYQKVIGFKVVNDNSLIPRLRNLEIKNNFEIIDASFGKYGKITDEIVDFVNYFWRTYNIPLDPIYTGKMMITLTKMINENFFPKGSKILVFHTGGLQGILGANEFLRSKNRKTIEIKGYE